MFRKSFLAATVTAGMFLLGCDKTSEGEDNSTIIVSSEKIAATVAAVGDKVDEVRLVIDNPNLSERVTLATAEFKSDAFSIQLPADPPSAYLFSVRDEWEGFDGIQISDDVANILYAEVTGYKSGVYAGWFQFGIEEPATVFYFVYADRDVSITSTDELDDDHIKGISVHLKKGWNIMAETGAGENGSDAGVLFTTTIPEGMIKCKFNATEEQEPSDGTIKTLTATVENGNDYNSLIDEVKIHLLYIDDIPTPQGEYKGSYANGGFTINLPELESELLEPATNLFGQQEGLNISGNADALMALGVVVPYSNGNEIGNLGYQYSNVEEGAAELLYFDSDVTFTGNVKRNIDGMEITYNTSLNLKKGWNMIYQYIVSQTLTHGIANVTTVNPGGMKWYFEPYRRANTKSATRAGWPMFLHQ